MMKAIFLSIAVLFSIAILSCNKDDESDATIDHLEDTGILGSWEIHIVLVNNISSGAAECCEFVVFQKDDEPKDLKGHYRAYGTGYDNEGTFVLNKETKQIITTEDNDVDTFMYSVSDQFLDLSYEDDGDIITLGYIKRE